MVNLLMSTLTRKAEINLRKARDHPFLKAETWITVFLTANTSVELVFK